MDIGYAFFIVAVLGIISVWIWAAYRANVQGELHGIVIFFFHMIAAVATVGLLWLLLVYPYTDCTERLCGFEAMVMWMVISLIILIVWPLVLIALINKKFPRPEPIKKKTNDNILDEEV